ncbi:peptidyl-prolyl isomerase CWC27 protein [Rutstroemia sp. NJR-2017a WRK4]|nr:peptidyl-prolyl isomerase CWC27 protein [Rutstroemia sp. NJR-2017a WRK4]
MSSLYNLEPQPTASCILHTTSGDISLELWAQQVPLACRNFLQHCLDGYYDNTIFHRLVPGFILQGGDPTGTGSGGESIYDGGAFAEENGVWPMEERKGQNAGPRGVGFKDEFHSRIKYNRRGLLGMANEGKDTNGSQFFITLGDTRELTGRNTLFGRVEGETIYNVARMGEAELGEGDRPLWPTKITGVEVLVNPFKDMVRRERVAARVLEQQGEKKAPEKKKKRKAGKQLLSFGGDEDAAEEEKPVVKKAKFDTRIVMDDESAGANATGEKDPESAPKPKSAPKKKAPKEPSPESSPEPEPTRAPAQSLPNRAAKLETREISSSPEPEPQVEKVTSLLDRTNAQIAELKASMKRNVPTGAAVPEKKKSALEAMIPANAVRGRKRGAAGKDKEGDQAALDILKAFREKLEKAGTEKGVAKVGGGAGDGDVEMQTEDAGSKKKAEVEEDEEAALCDLHFIANCQSCSKWDEKILENGEKEGEDDEDGGEWMAHALSFKEDKLGKDLSYRRKAEEELVVIDPRVKERELGVKGVKGERERRGGREWDRERGGGAGDKARGGDRDRKGEEKGGPSRGWDREGDRRRNEKLAGRSRMAGRAAK